MTDKQHTNQEWQQERFRIVEERIEQARQASERADPAGVRRLDFPPEGTPLQELAMATECLRHAYRHAGIPEEVHKAIVAAQVHIERVEKRLKQGGITHGQEES